MADKTPNPQPKRVLIVAPHPDDAEFMAGGTMAKWARGGAYIHFLLVTDGISGSRDPNQTHEQLAAIRHEEQREAARRLGAHDVTFLGYHDGRVEASIELRFAIARVIRQVRPDVVIAGDPQFRYSPTYINHPDHRAVADASLAAIMPTANTRLAALELLDEGLEPHDVTEVYLSYTDNPSVWIPLEAEDIERQAQALRAHVSQLGDWEAEKMLRERASETAKVAREKGVECEFAESFYYIRLHGPKEEPEVKAEEPIAAQEPTE